jgi:hypothetical protein
MMNEKDFDAEKRREKRGDQGYRIKFFTAEVRRGTQRKARETEEHRDKVSEAE